MNRVPETLRKTHSFWSDATLTTDMEFDSIYDRAVRELSAQHWTPVRIAARAARLLTQNGATRILDIGSGVGKFCIVGALTTDAEFVGVERRGNLVSIARAAASRLGASRATFVHTNIDAYSLEGFDGIYLYNPFYEQISRLLVQIDDAIEGTDAAYRHYVRATVDRLRALKAPVAVVTFNGFGGIMPRDFTFRGDEPAGNDRLEVWTKM
jgi:predicted RNA methylase